RSELTTEGQLPAESSLAGMPIHALTWRRRIAEASWALLDWPAVERWTGPIDWVYCPADAYVSHRRCRLAVTIHFVNWFERELPWYRDRATRSTRRSMWPRYFRYQRRADLIFPVSEFLRQRIHYLFGIPMERMVVVGNGVEDAYFEAGPLNSQLAKQ